MGLLDTIIHDVMSNKIECVICGDDVICSRMMSRFRQKDIESRLISESLHFTMVLRLTASLRRFTAVNILARQQGVTIGKQMIHCLKGELLQQKKTMLDYEILLRKSAGRTFLICLIIIREWIFRFLQEYMEKE